MTIQQKDRAYTTPAASIRGTAWRIAFTYFQRRTGGRGRCIEYEWQGADGTWRNMRAWSTYDFNDGQTAGLPPQLAQLHRREAADIAAWIERGRVPALLPEAECGAAAADTPPKIRARAEQKPCNIGLFDDDARAQTDLEDFTR